MKKYQASQFSEVIEKVKRKNGGEAAIYLKNGFEARLLMNDHVESCEIVAIEIDKLNIINIVIYRPPDMDSTTFTRVMNKVKCLLSVMDTQESIY